MEKYEERHLITYDTSKMTKPEMLGYLNSIGLGANVIHPTGNGALVVKIPKSKQNLVEIIQSYFKDKTITINPYPLPP